MVSIKYSKNIVSLALVALVSACSSTSGPQSSAVAKQPVDIYEQLKNDKVQYAEGEVAEDEKSPEYIMNNMREARAAYFKKDFVNVRKYCNRTIKVAPSTTEAYYWLARIAVDEGDFQQANELASKALTTAKEPNMKTELQNMKRMTEMGTR